MGVRTDSLRYLLCAAFLLTQANPAAANGVQLPVLTGGAVTLTPGNSYPPNAYSYRWPGSYFEGRFTGTSVDLVVQDWNDVLQVSVDGTVYAVETTVGSADIHLGPFPDGEHLVRMDMLTESYYTPEFFVGFTVPSQANVLPAPQSSPRQIEFIGDSYTAGYGDLSNSVSCPGNANHTSTPLSFGPLTANHYGADYRINAITGLGMVRNYGGELPGQAMSELYDFTTAGAPWSPQVIAIMLGQNDFSTGLSASEKWSSVSALEADFESTYVNFVEKLRALHPHAYFILMAADATALTQTEVQKVLGLLQAAPYNETRIGYLPINGLSYSGCDYHPNQADHLLIKQDLIGYISKIPDIWQGVADTAAVAAGSSILWHDSSIGQVVLWQLSGGTIGASAAPGAPSAEWVIQGAGDFNNDGTSDILWRSSASGQVVIWFMKNGSVSGSASPASPPADWVIQGVGDFNHDGYADILWRNSITGQVVIWLMNNGVISGSVAPGTPSADWVIQGVGDFNNDGTSDILWRNTNSGQVVIWFMQNGAISNSVSPGAPAANWTIQGVGDFNGDGDADIVWRDANSGQVAIWLMTNGQVTGSASPGAPSADWLVQGVGDFNQDGNSDLLWRNTNGDVVIWMLTNGLINSSFNYGVIPANWNISTVGLAGGIAGATP